MRTNYARLNCYSACLPREQGKETPGGCGCKDVSAWITINDHASSHTSGLGSGDQTITSIGGSMSFQSGIA